MQDYCESFINHLLLMFLCLISIIYNFYYLAKRRVFFRVIETRDEHNEPTLTFYYRNLA